MPYLIQPSADARLRPSFLEAMREFETTTGRADAGGLTVRDLEGATCLRHYSTNLREGTSMRPGTAPLKCCEWWWVDGGPDEMTYIGRVSLTHTPAPGQGHLRVSVRPSRRREGHGTAILKRALPFAEASRVKQVRAYADTHDMAARKMIAKCGGHLQAQQGGRLLYLFGTAE